MTTAEAVIPYALVQKKDYDVFKCVVRSAEFIASEDVREHFRFRVCSVEGFTGEDDHNTDSYGSSPTGTSTTASKGEMFAVATIYAYGEQVCLPLSTSHSTLEGTIDEWVCFPIDVSELPLDSVIGVEVYNVDGLVGSSTFHYYSSKGEAKSGLRRYKLHQGKHVDTNEDSNSTYGHWTAATWDKLYRDHLHGRMPSIPWMDELSSDRIEVLNHERGLNVGIPVVVVEFPMTSSKLPIYHSSVPHNFDSDAHKYNNNPGPFIPVHDLDINVENLSEVKASILTKSLHLVADKTAHPTASQRKRILSIVNSPLIQMEGFKVEDAALMWQFRYYLHSRESRAFVPFMQCVDWQVPDEASEASKFVKAWKSIPIEDALGLLGVSFKHVFTLRAYAISILEKASDETLLVFLLQLVQGVRYDVKDELADFLLNRGVRCWEIASYLYWYISVEADMEAQSAAATNIKNWDKAGADSDAPQQYTALKHKLMNHLQTYNGAFMNRLLAQEKLRSVLAAIQNAVVKFKLTQKIAAVVKIIEEKSHGIAELFDPNNRITRGKVSLPTYPNIFIDGILTKRAYVFKSAKQPLKITLSICDPPRQEDDDDEDRGATTHDRDKDGKEEEKEYVKSEDQEEQEEQKGKEKANESMDASRDEEHEDGSGHDDEDEESPDVVGAELVKRSDSATASALVGGACSESARRNENRSSSNTNDSENKPQLSSAAAAAAAAAGRQVEIIFKNGDDVRQDQLVIQLIELMDGLLKANGLDLCLTPYRVIATSQFDGFMEVVENVKTFQEVEKDTVLQHLAKYNHGPEATEAALHTFVKSCAGYCVITFLLGIGDRHLENLLITKDGRLLHIDFGYILGRDPKPFPPPMKINKEMIDAMGGTASKNYALFKSYCCSAYNILRKHDRLIINLLLLMAEAQISDVVSGASKNANAVDAAKLNLLKVQDKLRLDLNDAEATQYIQQVIQDSAGAMLTNLWDVVHKAAQAVRN